MSNEIAVFEKQLTSLSPQLSAALGDALPVDRLIRTVTIAVERNPRLLECDKQSLFNAAMSAAVLGLEVDGVTGQAFLIPFKNRAQLVVGYRGLNTLAARAGITITGSVVREGDVFDYDLGEGWITHKPIPGNKNRIVAAWAKAAHSQRPSVVTVLGIDDLLAVKARSPGARRDDSPWNEPLIGFPAMCEKTAKRRLARSLPMNTMQTAARMDQAVEEEGKPAYITPDRGVIIDGEIIAPTATPSAEQLIGSAATAPPPARQKPSPPQPHDTPGAGTAPPLQAMAREAAMRGRDVFLAFYKERSAEEQAELRLMKPELEALYPTQMS
jgi:recombination protein RecT